MNFGHKLHKRPNDSGTLSPSLSRLLIVFSKIVKWFWKNCIYIYDFHEFFSPSSIQITCHYVLSGLCFLGVILIFLEPVLFRSVNAIENMVEITLHAGPIIGGLLTVISGIFHISCGYMKRK